MTVKASSSFTAAAPSVPEQAVLAVEGVGARRVHALEPAVLYLEVREAPARQLPADVLGRRDPAARPAGDALQLGEERPPRQVGPGRLDRVQERHAGRPRELG